MSLPDRRLKSLKDAYASGKLDEETVETLLDAIVRDRAPFHRGFILKQASTFVRAGTVEFYGVELVRDGELYYPADGDCSKPFSTQAT